MKTDLVYLVKAALTHRVYNVIPHVQTKVKQ